MPTNASPLGPIHDHQIRPAATAMVRSLPDGSSVVLDLETEKYFGLDAVGAQMWTALVESPTVAAARDQLLRHFDVEDVRLDADLAEFVDELESRGLVVVSKTDGDEALA